MRSESAEKAGQFTEAALMGAMPMYVPDFKNVVMPAIIAALDEWKRDSEKSEQAAHMRLRPRPWGVSGPGLLGVGSTAAASRGRPRTSHCSEASCAH